MNTGLRVPAAAQAGPSFALWPAVWKLLRLRLTILVNGVRRAKLRRKIGLSLLALLFLGFLGFIFFLSWMLLRFLRSPELVQIAGNVTPFLESVPVLIIGGAFVGILLTSFGVLLQALYLAGDMDFLLSTPIPIRAVFIAKLLQAILPNFSLISLFALPVLFGLGAAGGYNIFYYPMVVIVLAALALAAAGLSSLLVMLVVRIFPARRVAEVLGFVGAISSFLCSQTGQLARFEEVSAVEAGAAFEWASRLDSPWMPLAWAGRGLVALGEGQWLAASVLLLLSTGLALLIFGVALTTAERLYYNGWASMQGTKTKKKPARPARADNDSWLKAALRQRVPATLRAILVKDYFVLRRDLRNMSQLVTPLIFGVVYGVLMLRNDAPLSEMSRGTAPWIEETMRSLPLYGSVGISLFVGWMLLGRLAGMGFSQEGRNYWILKTAPVSAGQLLTAKFLVAYLPALFLGWLFLLVITLVQGGELSMLLFTLPVVALAIAGNAGLNLAFGVVGANLNWEDPRQMVRGTSSCLSAIAVFLYLPLTLALFFGPPLIVGLLGWPQVLGQLAGLFTGGIFSLAAAVLPVLLVKKRVGMLGEDT